MTSTSEQQEYEQLKQWTRLQHARSTKARQQEVMHALEQAIAETQEEIRQLEMLLAVKRAVERLQADEPREDDANEHRTEQA